MLDLLGVMGILDRKSDSIVRVSREDTCERGTSCVAGEGVGADWIWS